MNNIKKIVFSCVKNIGKEHKNKKLMLPNDKTVLFGANLDSMGIVFLVTDIEQEISEELGLQLALADERAMSQKTSPFRSISTLVKYIEKLVNENKKK